MLPKCGASLAQFWAQELERLYGAYVGHIDDDFVDQLRVALAGFFPSPDPEQFV